MLPEFANARRKMIDLWNQAMFAGLHGSDPLLADLPMRVQREGDKASIGDKDMEYKTCRVEFKLDARDAEGMSFSDFVEGAFHVGKQMAEQQARHLFETLAEPTPHSRMMPWKLGEVTFDDLLDVWRTMQIDFGTDGLARWPTIVVSPEAHTELAEKMPLWLENAECMRKWGELAEQKRTEWNEREACRKLVD